MVRDFPEVFEGVTSMVDVGGSTGATAKALVDVFPCLNCTALVLPYVVASLKGTMRLDYVVGDMFKVIPLADIVFLKVGEECVKILKHCKGAIPSKEKGGKVVMVDMVVARPGDHPGN